MKSSLNSKPVSNLFAQPLLSKQGVLSDVGIDRVPSGRENATFRGRAASTDRPHAPPPPGVWTTSRKNLRDKLKDSEQNNYHDLYTIKEVF